MKTIAIIILLTALFGCMQEEEEKKVWQAPPASELCPELKNKLELNCHYGDIDCKVEKESAFRECRLRTRVY